MLADTKRARAFYGNQVLDHVNAHMREYLARQEMMFVSTADAAGNCDCTFRAGPPGFVKVLDGRTVTYYAYRRTEHKAAVQAPSPAVAYDTQS